MLKIPKDGFKPTISPKYFVNPEIRCPAEYMTRGIIAIYLFGNFRVWMTKKGIFSCDVWIINLVAVKCEAISQN